jgi:Tfp pilus assembly protein PilX
MTGPALFRKQKGVALFIALIALVVLMIAAIALVRSTDTAQLISGNLAVKRDLTHESELALQAALANFNGALAGEGARWTDLASANYSASVLASNNQGIPTALSTAPLTVALHTWRHLSLCDRSNVSESGAGVEPELHNRQYGRQCRRQRAQSHL